MTQKPLTLYKLIILYMLERGGISLTYAQISSFILGKEYTDFITLPQVLSELQDAAFITSKTLMNRTYYSITQEGHDTISYFDNRISDAIKTDIETFFTENRIELRNEASITANYYKMTSGEYEAELVAQEKNVELVKIKLSVPSEEMAETICNNWYRKNQEIFKYLLEELL